MVCMTCSTSCPEGSERVVKGVKQSRYLNFKPGQLEKEVDSRDCLFSFLSEYHYHDDFFFPLFTLLRQEFCPCLTFSFNANYCF